MILSVARNRSFLQPVIYTLGSSILKRMAGSGPPLNDMVKPLSWLLGKWRSDAGQGIYPTIDDFKYAEEVEFTHVGQPNIQFSFYSWHPVSKKPMHRELGFIRMQPGTNKVALMVAQNLGVAELEEGEVNGQEIKTESHTLGRMTFGKPPAVRKVSRVLRLDGETLEQIVEMETENTPMTEHLRVKYKKVE